MSAAPRYREYRCPCAASVVALTGEGRQRAEIVNISSTGARLSGAEGLEEGATLRLEVMAGMEPLKAEVRWVRGALAGLRFARPLGPEMIARLRGVAGAPPARPWSRLAIGARAWR